jgi:hypothetical protein
MHNTEVLHWGELPYNITKHDPMLLDFVFIVFFGSAPILFNDINTGGSTAMV